MVRYVNSKANALSNRGSCWAILLGNPAGWDAATHVAILHVLSQPQCRQPDRGRDGWDGVNRPIPVTVEVVGWAAAVLHGACPNYAVLTHQATLQSMTILFFTCCEQHVYAAEK
jgi:hypothetical protein